jgi:hypothetical protein
MYTAVGNGEDSTMYNVKHCSLIHSALIHIINEATQKNKGQPAHTHDQQLGREERGKRQEERGKNLVDGAHDGSTVPGVAEVQEARVVLVQEDAELGEALGRSQMHGRFTLPATRRKVNALFHPANGKPVSPCSFSRAEAEGRQRGGPGSRRIAHQHRA